MTRIFNKTKETDKRRLLRDNATTAETVLWSQIRNKKLNGLKFRRQFSINNYVVDFYCSRLKLAVEIDDSVHKQKRVQKMDKIRQEQIESLGITFLRFTNVEIINEISKIKERILAFIPRLNKERD
ncbi:DUF559 domain-containing protein [Candidatus Collierbacteria bacterium]|nr:DUF559 domain-containing protein [Candidatus Collierbacteria bacterium]